MQMNSLRMMYLLFTVVIFLLPTSANTYQVNTNVSSEVYSEDYGEAYNLYWMEFIPGSAAPMSSYIDYDLSVTVNEEAPEDLMDLFYPVVSTVNVDDRTVICSKEDTVETNVENIQGNNIQLRGTQFIDNANQDDLWILFLCKDDVLLENFGDESFQVIGEVSFTHAHGHLNYIKYSFFEFSRCLTLVYLFLFLIWIYILYKGREFAMKYHVLLLVLCYLILTEYAAELVYLINYNKNGMITNYFWLYYNQIINSITNGCIRWILLAISAGWGMATDKIKYDKQYKILVIIYAIARFINHRLEDGEPQPHGKIISITIAALEAIIASTIVWNFECIVTQLKATNQEQKLEFYDKFICSSIAIMATALVSIISHYYYNNNTTFKSNHLNDSWFFIGGSTRLVYLFSIMLLMYVFRPNEKFHMYMQATQLGAYDDFSLEIFDEEVSLKNPTMEPKFSVLDDSSAI